MNETLAELSCRYLCAELFVGSYQWTRASRYAIAPARREPTVSATPSARSPAMAAPVGIPHSDHLTPLPKTATTLAVQSFPARISIRLSVGRIVSNEPSHRPERTKHRQSGLVRLRRVVHAMVERMAGTRW